MRIEIRRSISIELDMLFFIALPVIFAAGYTAQYVLTFFAAFIHEAAHMATARVLGEKTTLLRILPVGLNAKIEDRVCNKYGRIAIYCSGPAINMVMAVVLTIVNTYYLYSSDNMRFFILMNVYLGAFNLLPVLPLDGGKILREILWDRVGIYTTGALLRRISALLALLIVVVGVIQMYVTTYNFSLLIIGLYVFFAMKPGEGEVGLLNVKNVVYRRSRLMKKGIYPARDLVVMKWVHMSELIKNLDFDRFHIVHVLDEDLRLLNTFTEQELIEGMLKNEVDITFEEFIRLQK